MPLKNSSVISNFIIIKEIKHWKNRAIHIFIPKASVVEIATFSGLNARMVYFLKLKTLKQSLELKAVVTFFFISEAKNCALIQENISAENCDSFQDMGFASAKASAFFRELIQRRSLGPVYHTSCYQIIVF